MENIYSEEQRLTRTVKASQGTVKFLLSYSKSLQVVDCQNQKFELNLN